MLVSFAVNTTLTASTSPSIVLPNQPSSGESSSDSVAAVTGGVVGGVAVVILIGLVLVVICVRKRKKRKINRYLLSIVRIISPWAIYLTSALNRGWAYNTY